MFGSAGAHNEVSDLVDHNRFGGSMPRAFSPGLSSIGAAGFGIGGRVSVEGVAEQKRGQNEESKMANTFGSIGVDAPNAFNNGMNVVPYPFSEDENNYDNNSGHQIKLVGGIQNYPHGSGLGVNSNNRSKNGQATIDSNDPRMYLGSIEPKEDGKEENVNANEHELIDDTFNVKDMKHFDEEVKRGKEKYASGGFSDKNPFSARSKQSIESRVRPNLNQEENKDYDSDGANSNKFPPIDK